MSAPTVSFFVPGTPRPQGSKRAFVNRHTGRATMVEQGGSKLQDWRGDVRRAAMDAMNEHCLLPFEGPLRCELIFQTNRPKSHPKTRMTYTTSRPDIDKLARAVLDALTGFCFEDDSQIIEMTLMKIWDKTPGVNVYLTSDLNHPSWAI